MGFLWASFIDFCLLYNFYFIAPSANQVTGEPGALLNLFFAFPHPVGCARGGFLHSDLPPSIFLLQAFLFYPFEIPQNLRRRDETPCPPFHCYPNRCAGAGAVQQWQLRASAPRQSHALLERHHHQQPALVLGLHRVDREGCVSAERATWHEPPPWTALPLKDMVMVSPAAAVLDMPPVV